MDVTIQPDGISGPNAVYTITPQPLPANMSFNRQTGQLIFSPAPGQAGQRQFNVVASDGIRTATLRLPLTVTEPALESTEVSGRVVDEAGAPLSGIPVSLGDVSATTDESGHFTLDGVSTDAAPLSAGGSVADQQGRLGLKTPVVQLLGHQPYPDADNLIVEPLILPRINWSAPASFRRDDSAAPFEITNPSMPGFGIQFSVDAAPRIGAAGTLSVASLPASLSYQHMPEGVRGATVLYKAVGIDLTQPVELSFPNYVGYRPGAVVNLLLMNMQTGGHDVLGKMVVSADGQTMTSLGEVTLASGRAEAVPSASRSVATLLGASSGFPGGTYSGCLGVENDPSDPRQNTPCDGCQTSGNDAAAKPRNGVAPGATQGNQTSLPNGLSPFSPRMLQYTQGVLASDAGLLTGEYFQDHETAIYQSQDQARGIDLQYSSGQAYPRPVVQYQFTTPLAGNSSSITSITAQVSLAGVSQGAATTYLTPSGLADETTYYIPLQVDGSALPTGAYPYTMTVTENFGSLSPSSVTMTADGYVNIVNAASDPLGAGWTVGGLQQVTQVASGEPAVVTAGQQGTERFDPVYDDGQSFVQDLAVVTGTSAAHVLANDSTGHFDPGPATTSGATDTAADDLDGDGKPDLAVVSASGTPTLDIFLNDGSGGLAVGSSYTLPSGTTPKAVAIGNFSGHLDDVLDIAVVLAPTGSGGGPVYTSVAVYIGNGDGTFGSPTVTSSGNAIDSSTLFGISAVAEDFNGDGMDDLAFASDSGVADVTFASGGGAMTAATALSLPSGDSAIGITAVDYDQDGDRDLVVETVDSNILELGIFPFTSLVLFDNSGTGTFSFTSEFVTNGHPDSSTLGIVAGEFNGPGVGLEIAVPTTDGGNFNYVDIVPLSSSGTWGQGTIHRTGAVSFLTQGNIVAADLNGSGKPSIVVSDGNNTIWVLLADPDSNQFLPMSTVDFPFGAAGILAAAPFAQQAATPTFRGPTSDPSTLVHNSGGTWTRTYPDGTVLQFDSSGRETSITDRNSNTTSYAYLTSGAATGALHTITDPVGLITTLAYDVNGDLHTITDPAGRVTTITFDAHDNVTAIEDPDGATVQYGYTTPTNHLITTETSPNNHTATAHYNSFGQFTSETLFDGVSSTGVSSARSHSLLAPGDSGGLLTVVGGSVTDPNGRTTTVTFNWMAHPTSQADATGAITTTTFNRFGFPSVVTDPDGRITTYTFNAAGSVTSISRGSLASGGGGPVLVETIGYGVYEVPTSITDFNGHTTTFTLDSGGNVLRRTDPDGLHEDWTYNAAGQVLTDTGRSGHATSYAYDSYGRLTTITYPGAGTPRVLYRYDLAGDVTATTDELGHTTTFTYDQAGRVLSTQDPVQAAAGKATSYTYDADGNLLTATDALGHVTSFAYDARDRLIGMTDAVNQGTSHETSYGYDAAGNLTRVTDPLGHTTSFAYDDANRTIRVVDPKGNATTYVYDLAGLLTSELTPGVASGGSGGSIITETDYLYDDLGRLNQVYGGASGAVVGRGRYDYDANDNRTTATDPLGHTTTFSYDNLNQLTAVTDPLLHTTSYGYDADGNVRTVTDPNSHTTTYAYDVRDRLTSVTEPSGGGTTTYTYDLAGNLSSVTDPVGNVTTYTYDPANRVATETRPTGGVTTYAYDLVGNLTDKVDPLGRIIDYTYDNDNQQKGETWHASGGGPSLHTVTISYDIAGRETAITDNNSNYAFTYDNAGRLLTVDDNGTTGLPQVTLTYSYDGNGNRTSLSDSLGGLISYGYDPLNRLIQETQASGGGIDPERVDFDYDAADNLTRLTRYADLSGTSEVGRTVYQYDNANRLTTLNHQTAGGSSTVASYAYTLDPASRLTQLVKTWSSGGGSASDTISYGYTDNGQVTSVTHSNGLYANESFSYDANGNRNSSGYSTTTGNRLSTDGTYNYGYDADGNMTSKTDIVSGDQTLYVYDHRNRLIEVDQAVGGVTSVLATYTYDALDRRIGVSERAATTWTLYDENDPLLDFDGSGNVTGRYLNGPVSASAVDQLLARDTASGVAWYLTDQLGTVGDVVDNLGAVVDHVEYGAFGRVLAETAPTAGDRFKFAGLQIDMATGLNLAVYRVQDPVLGTWITKDPLGFDAGDANLYRYVGNDPTNHNDKDGLQASEEFVPARPIQGFWPTGNELRDPKTFPTIAAECEKLRNEAKDKMREPGRVVFKNKLTGNYKMVPTALGGPDRINFNTAKRPPEAGWTEVCTIHAHPPHPNGKPDPKDSPFDPANSNHPIGKSDVPVPWLVVGPDGRIFLIGPDKRGGNRNTTSR